MAKSQRSKREKRLRTIRREITIPFYDKQEAAKLAAQEVALAAPKLPPRTYNNGTTSMELITDAPTQDSSLTTTTPTDVEMIEGGGQKSGSLKPIGKISKKMKKKLKMGKRKHKGGGKIRRKRV